METCIIIASHISNVYRSKYLLKCLESLVNQTHKIPIYLSISFESDLDKTLLNKQDEQTKFLEHELINVNYEKFKTSQFRHIENVVNKIKLKFQYVMFCDDDDTYELNRVEKLLVMTKEGSSIDKINDKIFVGAYEMDLDKGNHSTSYYEYWSYCININFIINFFNILKTNNFDYIIDNKMCDVLFSQYLRHLDEQHIFVSAYCKLYNYNETSEYSITNSISQQNTENAVKIKKQEYNFKTFIQGLNDTLELNFESIKQNILILCSYENSFGKILKSILRENYIYKDKINKDILKNIKNEYDTVKHICDVLYMI